MFIRILYIILLLLAATTHVYTHTEYYTIVISSLSCLCPLSLAPFFFHERSIGTRNSNTSEREEAAQVPEESYSLEVHMTGAGGLQEHNGRRVSVLQHKLVIRTALLQNKIKRDIID
jgi:hypothetical protein